MPKAAPFRQVGPDRVEIRDGGGWRSLFGLPLLAAGVFIALAGAGVVPLQNPPPWPPAVIVLMSLFFVAAGGVQLCGRRRITLDMGRGCTTTSWRFLVPVRRTERSLHEYDAVAIRFQQGDKRRAPQYHISLRGKAPTADLLLASLGSYGYARDSATTLARFLGMPMADAATAHESVSAGDRLDETLRDRIRRGGEAREEAIRPVRLRTQVQESAGKVEIVIPGPGFKYGTLLRVAGPLVLLLVMAPYLLDYFQGTDTPETGEFVFLGVVILFLGILPVLYLLNALRAARRTRTRVTASPDGIVVEIRQAWRTRETRIAAADILGLDHATAEAALDAARHNAEKLARPAPSPAYSLGRGPTPLWLRALGKVTTSQGITVKARTGLVTFGAGLPDDEVRYLHAIVARVLAEGPSRW
jgi:hypothetical protein